MRKGSHFRPHKKISRAVILIPMTVTALMFSGCGNENKVTVTAEQNDLIAEYVAGTLMKYSYQNQWKYIKLNDNITNFEMPSETVAPTKPSGSQKPEDTSGSTKPATGSTSSAASGTLADLAAALDLDGISITYTGCVVGKSYPEGSDIFTVKATRGRDIAALEFNLKNMSDKTVICNTAPLSLVMKLNLNDNSSITEYATILKNDLNMLSDVSIAPGEEFKAAVLFMVAEGSADNINSLDITLVEGGKVLSKIALK